MLSAGVGVHLVPLSSQARTTMIHTPEPPLSPAEEGVSVCAHSECVSRRSTTRSRR